MDTYFHDFTCTHTQLKEYSLQKASTMHVLLAVCCLLLHTAWGAEPYVERHQGHDDSRIILAAPHGGALKPSSIPDRQHGCYDSTTGQCDFLSTDYCTPDSIRCRRSASADLYTKALTENLAKELQKLIGKAPHVVLTNLHRSKLDANRAKEEAAQGNNEAVAAYDDYHECIREAKAVVTGNDRAGILFDIHGTSHLRVEVGYLLSRTRLNSGNCHYDDTSIRGLAQARGMTSTEAFLRLVRGNVSFGTLLSQELTETGTVVVPSAQNPTPGDSPYYRGGYTVKKYGSRDGGVLDAIQIESPKVRRKDSAYPAQLARAIKAFMDQFPEYN